MTKKVDYTVADVQAYFIASLSIVLARKGRAFEADEVPMLRDVAMCYGEYVVDFDSKFVFTPVDDKGEPQWITNENRTGLVGPSYEYWQQASTFALMCENELSGERFGLMASAAIKELDTNRPVFIPAPLGNKALLDDAKGLGAYCASRAAYWMTRARAVLRNADSMKFRPVYRCTVADLLNVFSAQVMLKDSDVDVNDPKAIDHNETADVGTMSLSEMRRRYSDEYYLQPVEYEKFMAYAPAMNAWHQWAIALNAEDDLHEELGRSIERAKEWVETNKKSKPQISARKKATG